MMFTKQLGKRNLHFSLFVFFYINFISCPIIVLSLFRRSNNNAPLTVGYINRDVRGGASEVDTDIKSTETGSILIKEVNETTAEEIISNKSASYLTFAASKVGDGSESDPDGLPLRFLNMQKGNREKAKLAFNATVAWREKHNVNTILSKPHPTFDICRQCFPIYVPGKDVAGNVILVQRPGKIDLKLAREHNVTEDDIILHYVYLVEYCWNILHPGPPDGVMTTIIDLKGLGLSTFRDTNSRNFVIKFVKTMSNHYPQRSYKTLIINAPSWITAAYKLLAIPFMRASTREKISFHYRGKKQDETLRKFLGDSMPKELLHDDKDEGAMPPIEENTIEEPGSNSTIEKQLRMFVSCLMCLYSIKYYMVNSFSVQFVF